MNQAAGSDRLIDLLSHVSLKQRTRYPYKRPVPLLALMHSVLVSAMVLTKPYLDVKNGY